MQAHETFDHPSIWLLGSVSKRVDLTRPTQHATRVMTWRDGMHQLREGVSSFVFFAEPGDLSVAGFGRVHMPAHSFACVNGGSTHGGCGLVIMQDGYLGQTMLGGPLEAFGRLRYIDGCTDSLLVPPTLLGDPCFNHLHFPAGTVQTMHTHPSDRIGMVVRGRGRCVLPDTELPLVPGMVFVIKQDGPHCFATDDSSMDVVAFHPDSDWGPQHQDHPMLNRTIVKGVSARELPELQTKP